MKLSNKELTERIGSALVEAVQLHGETLHYEAAPIEQLIRDCIEAVTDIETTYLSAGEAIDTIQANTKELLG